MSREVFKFGGVSVGSAAAIRTAIGRVGAAAPEVAVVVSAMNGMTDLLLAASAAGVRGETSRFHAISEEFRSRHVDLVRQVVSSRAASEDLQKLIEDSTRELTSMCESVATLREQTPRARDAVVARGERVLARIFAAALDDHGVPTHFVEATDLIFTVRRFESLWPDFARGAAAGRRLLASKAARGRVLVIPGFLGTGPDGETVTLGRGGSDFSAAIVARSLRARAVTLFKEVDGLMTADPRYVSDARVIPELHYREAAELAYYGAKVLHPRTIIPLVDRRIPLYIRNTFNDFAGTRIAADVKPGDYPVKALTAIHEQALVSVEGSGMIGVPGIASRTFAALAQAGHSVSMISQASSEASICFVVPAAEAEHAARSVEDAFDLERQLRLIDRVRIESPVALVAVVGLGMRGTPGIAARTFSTLGSERINILAIAQGSSELNITLAVAEKEAERAIRELHAEFQLEKLRALPNTEGREAKVTLLGFGRIGRQLARQIAQQDRHFRFDLGINLKCIAVADRSGIKVNDRGFSPATLGRLATRKESGARIAGEKAILTLSQMADLMRRELWVLPSYRPVLVDLTSEETLPLLQEALEAGVHLVLANKKPLAAQQTDFDRLFETAREKGVALRYEATAGAGLPIFDTLKKLREAGDRIDSIVGCFSGTLGYIMTQLEQGVAFSQAVRQAFDLGYTEPDPRDDLSGLDVARKALILARTLGRRLELSDIDLDSLFPPSLDGDDAEVFMSGLASIDHEYAERVAAARRDGCVLRYVARIQRQRISVGIESLPEASPMGRLRGSDNQVVIQTKRYRTNPLVVTGPGAGAEVTAAGVLNDIVAIAGGEARIRVANRQRVAR